MKKSRYWLFGLVVLVGWTSVVEGASTKVVHTPPSHVVPGYRIHMTVQLDDPSGIQEARCYFRGVTADDYVFVVLEESASGMFYGVLPPLADTTARLEYLFQALNGNNELVSTRPITVPVKVDDPPPWQADVMLDVFRLMTERARTGWRAPGFTGDNTVHVMESTRRYGSISDIYPGIDPGPTVGTDRGIVDVTPEPEPAPSKPSEPEPPRSKLGRNILVGGVVAGGAVGAAVALSGSSSSGNENEEVIDPGPGALINRLEVNADEGFSTVVVNFARGTATGPEGARFRLDATGFFGRLSDTRTIGPSNTATIQLNINQETGSCTTVIVRGTVTGADGSTLAERDRSFSYLCDSPPGFVP